MKTPAPASGSTLWQRPTAWTLALIGITFAAGAQAREEYNQTYTVSGRAHVRVHADDSHVSVVTADVKEVQFHAVYEGADWGLKIGERPHIESHQDGDVVELNARLNWNLMIGYNGRRMRVEVRMPRDADLEIETADGGVELAGLNGNVSVHTGDGAIHAAQLNGRIDLHTNDGSITADALQGEIRLRTSDGHVRGTHLTGGCEAESGDGSIEVDGQFQHLGLRSRDGRIAAMIQPGSQIADASSWSVRTGDGSVHVALPKDFKASLDASTGDGSIHAELPVQIEGETGKRFLRGTLNGGGPGLHIHTSDGSIDLKQI